MLKVTQCKEIQFDVHIYYCDDYMHDEDYSKLSFCEINEHINLEAHAEFINHTQWSCFCKLNKLCDIASDRMYARLKLYGLVDDFEDMIIPF